METALSKIDGAQFRRVLGHFASGVCVITANAEHPVGMAANAFSSVSLDPPLVMFAVAHTSETWPEIQRAGHFVVNMLGEGQDALCRRFSQRGIDRFEGVSTHTGRIGAPILDDAIAFIECTLETTHLAGDHLIVVGAVVDLAVCSSLPPLIFFRGGFPTLATA